VFILLANSGGCSGEYFEIGTINELASKIKLNVMIMHGGGVHFAKDAFVDEKFGSSGTIYGRVVKQTQEGWGEIIDGIYIKSLFQEHGVVHVSDELLPNYKVGDFIHSSCAFVFNSQLF
jgi:hypothetical protein